jgi:hypothetical protein
MKRFFLPVTAVVTLLAGIAVPRKEEEEMMKRNQTEVLNICIYRAIKNLY